MTAAPSPFHRALSVNKRLKLFLWGDSGVGKTTLALQFPRPVVIDLEGGTDLYASLYDFDVVRATTADEVMTAAQWLLDHRHEYQTVVIDPITVYWDALQKKWSDIFLRRNTGSKAHRLEFYDLQPRDWMTIKAEMKELVRKLIALDMNVIVTARQKAQYADKGFMRVTGVTFDGEKSLPYLFDTIVRLYRDENGRFLAECLKDRSKRLPLGEFECSYEHFEELPGKHAHDHHAGSSTTATDEQKQLIRTHLADLQMPQEQVDERLAAYGAQTLDDLNSDSASVIIQKLEAANARKKATKESL